MSTAKRASKDAVYRELVQEIVSGELAPGTPLSERALVARFGLSRTPIREVLWQLERDDLIVLHVNRGAFVKTMSADEILELFQLREALEPLAAMLAAARRPDGELAELDARLADAEADDDRDAAELVKLGEALHDALVRWSGNGMLTRIYDALRMQTQLMRNLLHDSHGSERASLHEHRAIIDAVRLRDGGLAHQQMTEHLRRARMSIIRDLFQAPPDWDAPLVAVRDADAGDPH